jgi:hypothetical protein
MIYLLLPECFRILSEGGMKETRLMTGKCATTETGMLLHEITIVLKIAHRNIGAITMPKTRTRKTGMRDKMDESRLERTGKRDPSVLQGVMRVVIRVEGDVMMVDGRMMVGEVRMTKEDSSVTIGDPIGIDNVRRETR